VMGHVQLQYAKKYIEETRSERSGRMDPINSCGAARRAVTGASSAVGKRGHTCNPIVSRNVNTGCTYIVLPLVYTVNVA
jgi:hypothetical protein